MNCPQQLGAGDRRVYLTGGSGFLGTNLRAMLAEQNVPVTLLLHQTTDLDLYPGETVEQGDILDPDSFSLTCHDIVIHLAAQTSIRESIANPDRTWRINADGTANILEKARKTGVERFLYASTASVYGPPSYLPIDEQHPTNPAEPYGASKLAGDGLVRSYASSYDINTVIARIFNTFGPGQPSYNVVGTILSQASAGERIELGNLSPARDFIYVKDVVAGLLKITEQGEPGTAYNIGRGESLAVGDIAELALDVLDIDADIVSEQERQRSDDIEIPDHVADTTRLRELGWEPSFDIAAAFEDMQSLIDGL